MMKKLRWLWVLLLALGLAFGLSLGACTTGGGDDDDTADDDADDDTDDDVDDDTDDDTEQFDVIIDQFSGPQIIVLYQGQIQAEMMDQLAMTADHLILFGASIVAPGTYTIDFDYNNPPQSIDPALLLILDWNAMNPAQYAEAYFAYNANVQVDSSGQVGTPFTGPVTEAKMIQANITIQGNYLYIEINPAGKKALVHFAFYNCKIADYPPGPQDMCM